MLKKYTSLVNEFLLRRYINNLKNTSPANVNSFLNFILLSSNNNNISIANYLTDRRKYIYPFYINFIIAYLYHNMWA